MGSSLKIVKDTGRKGRLERGIKGTEDKDEMAKQRRTKKTALALKIVQHSP